MGVNGINDDSGDGPVAQPVVIFSNDNLDAVQSGPPAAATFNVDQRYRVTSIRTYHWNGGAGSESMGTITLLDGNGAPVGLGAYPTISAEASLPNVYWECEPDVEIGPGTYTVLDSDPDTWSYNDASGNAGICVVMGVPLDGEDGTDVTPADAPDVVVKRFFDAQMAGDVDGMLAESALHLMPADHQDEMTGALEVIRDRASLEGSVTHLATGYNAEGDQALVRCGHTVKVTVDGYTVEQEGGTFLWLVLHEGRWKIRNLYPDEVLALALAERDGLLNAEPRLKPIRTWQQISAQFDATLQLPILNMPKAGADAFFSAVGANALGGDAISIWYTWGDMVHSSIEVSDDYEKGRLISTMTGITSVGWGFVQIIAEPIPVLDHVADGVGILMDQIHTWVWQKENYMAMLAALKAGNFTESDTFLAPRDWQALPNGIEWTHANEWLGKELVVSGVTFLTDDAMRAGQPLVFDVVAQMAVKEAETPTYYQLAVFLGAPTTASGLPNYKTAWLGVRITSLITGSTRNGPDILVPQAVDSTGARFRITAARGEQALDVDLRGQSPGSASSTLQTTVENRVFNAVDGLTIGPTRDAAVTELNLAAGETVEGLQLFGTISDPATDPRVQAPVLTLVDPSRIEIDNPEIVTVVPSGVWPNARLAVTGEMVGSTRLSLHLLTTGLADSGLDASVLINVKQKVSGTWRFVNRKVSHDAWEDRVDYLNLYAFSYNDLGNDRMATRIARTDSTDLEDYFAGVHGWTGLGADTLTPGETLSVTLSAAASRTAVFSPNLTAAVVFSVPNNGPYTHESVEAGNTDTDPTHPWQDNASNTINWQVPQGQYDGETLKLFIEVYDWGALDDTPGAAQEYNKVVIEYKYQYAE